LEELLVVADVFADTETFDVVEIRFPPVDISPLVGVDGGGNILEFVLAFGVGGPPEENIDGNCCCCC
jgi:hypothetical protein